MSTTTTSMIPESTNVTGRTRSTSKTPMSSGARIYSFPSGLSIHVHRHPEKRYRWASAVSPIERGRLPVAAFPCPRHIAALNLWELRNKVTSVYEFPPEAS